MRNQESLPSTVFGRLGFATAWFFLGIFIPGCGSQHDYGGEQVANATEAATETEADNPPQLPKFPTADLSEAGPEEIPQPVESASASAGPDVGQQSGPENLQTMTAELPVPQTAGSKTYDGPMPEDETPEDEMSEDDIESLFDDVPRTTATLSPPKPVSPPRYSANGSTPPPWQRSKAPADRDEEDPYKGLFADLKSEQPEPKPVEPEPKEPIGSETLPKVSQPMQVLEPQAVEAPETLSFAEETVDEKAGLEESAGEQVADEDPLFDWPPAFEEDPAPVAQPTADTTPPVTSTAEVVPDESPAEEPSPGLEPFDWQAEENESPAGALPNELPSPMTNRGTEGRSRDDADSLETLPESAVQPPEPMDLWGDPVPGGSAAAQVPPPAPPAVREPPQPTRVDINNTRHLAWVLGSKLSLASLAPLMEADQVASANDWQLEAVAQLLNVEPPQPPADTIGDATPARAILGLLNNSRRVGEDLAYRHGVDHAALVEVAVKTNALVLLYEKNPALADPVRKAVEAAATRAKLPVETWQPLIDLLDRDPTNTELRSAVFDLHGRVETLLRDGDQ